MQIAHLKALSADEGLTAVSNIIARFLPDARIFLFGSRARGDAEQTSDFDFAIDVGSKIPLDVIARIEGEIEELHTLKSVDIVDLNRVNPAFKTIILKTGVILHDGRRSRT
ncbi:MAG: nucleotidyltransferase domain-containing protein [Halobacteriota archaeon]